MFLSFTFYPEHITGCLTSNTKESISSERSLFSKKKIKIKSWGHCDETKRDRKLIEKKVLKKFANYNNIA